MFISKLHKNIQYKFDPKLKFGDSGEPNESVKTNQGQEIKPDTSSTLSELRKKRIEKDFDDFNNQSVDELIMYVSGMSPIDKQFIASQVLEKDDIDYLSPQAEVYPSETAKIVSTVLQLKHFEDKDGKLANIANNTFEKVESIDRLYK